MDTTVRSGIFQEASSVLLDNLKDKNKKGEITFLLPTKYVSEEAARMGIFLNNLFNLRRTDPVIFRTFFASCRWEVLSGTVKIIRHYHWSQTKKEGRILVYDPSGELKMVFQPIATEKDQLLVPGVEFESSFEQLLARQSEEEWIGLIFCWDGSIPLTKIDSLFGQAKKKGTVTSFDESLLKNWYAERAEYIFSSPPDIFMLGENITDWQVPFGSFSIRSEIYAPWDNISSCLTHSSSYTGNTLALSIASAYFQINNLALGDENFLNQRKERYRAYSRYINPQIGSIFNVTGLSPDVKNAQGSRLHVMMGGKNEEVVDGIAGSGCCLRGHNPPDLIPEVIDKHDTNCSYWDKLSTKLSALTKLPHVFPAVSGSTAVDIGIILGLVAQSPRTRILTFKNNYSGKSLISLNLSRFECFQAPFHPLYFDVIEIDPFAKDAKKQLEEHLVSNQIALVWFEILQGQNLDMIPDQILELINEHQEEKGYLIGIDEILTGFFRTGPFLCSSGKILRPDIITLAKGISDMSFPMACTLISDQVYTRAIDANRPLVDLLQKNFIHQMGAHIALHGLEKALEVNLEKHVTEMGLLFQTTIQQDVLKSPFHKEIRGKGLLLYLKLNKDVFPINVLGEEFIEFLMSSQYLDKGKALFLNSRLTPSLSIPREDMEELCKRIHHILQQTNRWKLFFFALNKIFSIYVLCWTQKIKEKIFKPKRPIPVGKR